jgi:hypothetical protein
VRRIDERAIKAHADLRFRSEYDYALFEYYRSAKVIAFLERAGVAVRGRVLDAGCGGGGSPKRRNQRSGSIPSSGFRTPACGSHANAVSPTSISRAPMEWRCPFETACSIWCCRTR